MKASIQMILILLVISTLPMRGQIPTPIPDKVYLHLERNLYAQGDTIWIKGYAMERVSHKPSNKSYTIHVQMLDEA